MTMAKKSKKAKAIEAEPAQARLQDNTHCDQLFDPRRRMWGIHTAVTGLLEDVINDDAGGGVQQLCLDVCERMDAIYAAFSAEQELRRLERFS
jgi:hypothetical protein